MPQSAGAVGSVDLMVHDARGQNPPASLLEGPRVLLRPITREDEHEFIRLARASADMHHPWMTLPATPEGFAAFASRFEVPGNISLLVCARQAGAILGLININNIVGGRFQCGSLGYCAFAPAAGRGYLSEGLELVMRYAFDDLSLHRLEANIQPGNHASLRLVERHGFRREGYSPGFLFIDGAWRDHERWAITQEMRARPVEESNE